MYDSTTDITPGEGAFETGSNADDHLGDLEAAAESGDEHASGIDAAEDRTAADVFDQLRDDADVGGTDDILADESPDDIIASANDPEPETETVDDALLADDDELTDLLLTGRSTDGEGEFHWVDPDGSGGSTATAGSQSASDAESTPAWEAGGTDLDDIFGDAVDDKGAASEPDGAAESGAADGAADESETGADTALEFDDASTAPETDTCIEDEPDATMSTESEPSSEGDSAPGTDDASSDDDVAVSPADTETEVPLEDTGANTATSESDAENGADPDLADGLEGTATHADDVSDAIPSLGTDDRDTAANEGDGPTDDADESTAEDDGSTTDSDGSSGPLSRLRSALNGLF
ncbi:hypothetical protein [Natrinema thermotolerans]